MYEFLLVPVTVYTHDQLLYIFVVNLKIYHAKDNHDNYSTITDISNCELTAVYHMWHIL